MKTAISIPDDAYRRIEQGALRLGLNRSEFFVTAALRFLDEVDQDSLVARIDEALARGGDRSAHEVAEFAAVGLRALADRTVDDEW